MQRRAALVVLGAALGLIGGGVSRPETEVVLYSSVDDYLLRQILPQFEKQTGIRVRLVGDTEATKTTGLVQRLIAERERPRADVWWSSEAMGTIALADAGLLEPYTSPAEKDVPGGWPKDLRGANGMWYGFASRARVIVYNTKRVTGAGAPHRLADLTDAKWKGRFGIARPQFGTTRTQMGALRAAWGEGAFGAWLEAIKANGVRLYDGNSAVVQAVAHGEVDAGLTDTDDVWAAQREGWPVDLVFEAVDEPGSSRWWSPGPLPLPNTIARVRGGPDAEAADRLIDFVLSERVERTLAASDSHNTPVREPLRSEFRAWAVPAGHAPGTAAIAAALAGALEQCDAVLGN
ncbi:MAG: extracellular solute-binding protein [Phycisphaerales bacterium]|nr:extracellular solute-binding protein [Phycisphaerales bacterium]